MKGDFESDIRDRDRFSEPTLDFKDSELLWVCFFVIFHIVFDVFNGLDDILYPRERTFSSDHIADRELKLLFILQQIFNWTFVFLLLLFETIF